MPGLSIRYVVTREVDLDLAYLGNPPEALDAIKKFLVTSNLLQLRILAYSDFASIRTGISGSASCPRVRNYRDISI
jgi:hypothetical protein